MTPLRTHHFRPVHFMGALLAALASLAGAGCKSPPLLRDYSVSLKIYGDPGEPLAGAEVSSGSRSIGRSETDGSLELRVRGTEGQVVSLEVRCPEGHRSPVEPLSIVLRRLSESDRIPEYPARCEPLTRTVVIAVRADGGAHLPLLYLGREVARTDRAGAAHFMLKSSPDAVLDFVLDTSQAPGLRPQNPSVRFEVGARDDVFVFSQKFQAPARPRPRTIRRVPGIIRLGAR